MTVSHVRTQKHKNADFCPEQFPRTGRRVPHSRHQSARLVACGDYCVDTKEKLVEILYFRHFAKHFTFTSEGKNSRNKHLKNYFDVSVVIDIGCGNTNEK